MGKAPTSDSIMGADKMKPLLALSKREPVQAAIALSSDGEGLILLDKKAKPKKVASLLRAAAAKAKLQLNTASVRFGRAEVDTEYDAGMVRFFINKDAPGNMRVKLVEVIKRIPYQKVEINVDPGLEDELEEDGEGAPGAPMSADGAIPPPAAPPQAPPAPSTAAPGPAPAALAQELGGLIRRVADAPNKAALAKLATDANVALKTNNLIMAETLISRLREALEGGATPVAPPPQMDVLRKDLAALIGRIAPAATANPDRKGELTRLAGEANTALKSTDVQAATDAVALLRAMISEVEGATPAATASTSDQGPTLATPRGVAYRKMLLRWREAQAAVETNLKTIGTTLLGRPDVKADSRLETIGAIVAKLPTLVPTFGGKLEDTLDAGMSAVLEVDAERLAKEGVAAIDAYRKQLEGAAALFELEEFAAEDLGTAVGLTETLDEALVDLRRELAA